MSRLIDIDSITDEEWYTVGRAAVEDVIIEMRDARISVLGRNNGLVCKEADGTPSHIIRLPIEDALKIGINAIVKQRQED